MYENAFNLQSDIQSICFDISEITKGVRYASVFCYHKGDFKTFKNEFPALSEENNKIALNNIHIYLAYDINNLTEDGSVGIDIDDNIELIYKEDGDKNIELYAQWIQYNNTTNQYNYYHNNNQNTDTDVELRWYKYSQLEKDNDGFGGDGWVLIDRQKKNKTYILPKEKKHNYKLTQTLNTSLEENKFKLIILDKNKVYRSQEIVFVKEEQEKVYTGLNLAVTETSMPKTKQTALDETVFDFTTCNSLDYQGQYYIYNRGNQIITEAPLIKLSAILDSGLDFASPECTKIIWKVPKNSMFKPNRKSINQKAENGYWNEDSGSEYNPYIYIYPEDFNLTKVKKSIYNSYTITENDEEIMCYEKYFIRKVIEKNDAGEYISTAEILDIELKNQEDFYLTPRDIYQSNYNNNTVICEVYLEEWNSKTNTFVSELKYSQIFEFDFGQESTNINGYKLQVSFLEQDEYATLNITDNHKAFQTDKLGPFRTTIVGKIILEDPNGQQLDLSSGEEIELSWKQRPKLNDDNIISCSQMVPISTTPLVSTGIDCFSENLYANKITRENIQAYTGFSTMELNAGYFAVSESELMFNKDLYLNGCSRAETLYQILLNAGVDSKTAKQDVQLYSSHSENMKNTIELQHEAFLNKEVLIKPQFTKWKANFNILKISIPKYNIIEFVPIPVICSIDQSLKEWSGDNYIKYNSNGKMISNNFNFSWKSNASPDGILIWPGNANNTLVKSIERIATEDTLNKVKFTLQNQYDKNKTNLCAKIGYYWNVSSSTFVLLSPIYIGKDSAVTKEIEIWDGKAGINELTGEVSGEQIIAGEKNSDNQFSGVQIGSIDGKSVNNGIIGFQSGEQTFSIDAENKIFSLGIITLNGEDGTLSIGDTIIDLLKLVTQT